MQGAEDEVALARYHGATRFLAGLGASCQVYLENLAECFPNQGALDTDQLYTFIEVGIPKLCSSSPGKHRHCWAKYQSCTLWT